MINEDSKKQYDALFPDAEIKAKAFDQIAEQFYYCNFGTMQKSDIETLIFSLYLDRILDNSEKDMQTYSDYKLSKYLGITQSKVSTLKERKELKYPYSGFQWKESFKRIMKNARYEKGKIKIHIPDKNLFIEVKNAVESNGGYIEMQINANLLQVSPEYYIDLILCVCDEKDRDKVRKTLKEKFKSRGILSDKDTDYFETQSIGDIIKENKRELGLTIVSELIGECIPVVGKPVKALLENVIRILPDGKRQ